MIRARVASLLAVTLFSGAVTKIAFADLSVGGTRSDRTASAPDDSVALATVLGDGTTEVVPESAAAADAKPAVELPAPAGTAPLLLSAFGSLGGFSLVRTVRRVDAHVWRGDGNIGVQYVDPFAPVGEVQERDGPWSYAPAFDLPSDCVEPLRANEWGSSSPDIPIPSGRPVQVADPRGPPLFH